MRAAIGLVDDLIERVEDYEIPKVVATVSTTNSDSRDRDAGTSRQRQRDRVDQPSVCPQPPTKPKIPTASRSAAGGNGTSTTGRSPILNLEMGHAD